MPKILLTCLLAFSALASDIPRIMWSVETSAPADRRLDLIYGETVDLQCRFTLYSRPMDIAGAAVILHARTNGMSESSSFQLAGVASSNGLATVRVPVSSWMPSGLRSASYTLEVTQTNLARILRAKGTVWLSGTSATASNAPLPVALLSGYATTASVSAVSSVLATHTNDAAAHLTPAQTQRIAAAITNETDAFALAALSTNRVTRWYNSESNWLSYSGGNTITEYWVTGAVETNITFSSDFSDTGTSQTLYPMTLPWPFDYSGWVGHDIDYLGTVSHYISSPGSGAEWICPIENSTLSPLSGNSAGTATISTAPIVGALVYKLQTNDVPPETWSYANMTNWLTEGGAGETWAIGIASDVANAIVNNHANTSGLHLLAGDRAKIDGAVSAVAVSTLIYSNSVSQLTIYTNASGAATGGWQVVHGVTSSWTIAHGTSGAITNGMNGPISIVASNGLGFVVTGTGSYGGTDPQGGAAVGLVYNSPGNKQLWFGSTIRGTGVRFVGQSLDAWDMSNNREDQMIVGGYVYNLVVPVGLTVGGGSSTISGDLSISRTNTAAEVRTLGGYSIFDYGSNCYWHVTASNGVFYVSDTNGVRRLKFFTETL